MRIHGGQVKNQENILLAVKWDVEAWVVAKRKL
jgi:hypothetical protein